MKKIIIKIQIGLTILCFVTFVITPILLIYWPDHSLADHSDLVPNINYVSESLAAPLVEFGKIDIPKIDTEHEAMIFCEPILKRTKEEWKIIAGRLQQTESFHRHFQTLSRLPEWKAPIINSYHDSILHRKPISFAVNDCALRAQFLHHQERTDEAIDMALTILQSGKKYSQAGGTIIEGIVAQSITSIAIENLCHMFQSDSINQSQIEKVNRALQNNRLAKDDFADCFRREFQVGKNSIYDLLNGSPSKMKGGYTKGVKYKYLFQPNHTINRYAECYRVMIDDLEHYKFAKAPPCWNYFDYDTKFDLLKTPNLIGRIHFNLLLPPNQFTSGFARTEVRLNLLSTLLAIRKFQLVEQRQIKSLTELVPNYLSELPKDPFDGASIKFNINKMRIYSIGTDFIDAKGKIDDREKGRSIARQHYEIYLDIPEYQRNSALN